MNDLFSASLFYKPESEDENIMAKFCRKCGTKLDKVTGLCPKCEGKKKHTGRRVIAIILVLALTAGGVGIAVWQSGLLSKKGNNPEEALSYELEQLLDNNGGLHFVSEKGEPIRSLQGGDMQAKIMACISYTLQGASVDKNTAVIDVRFTYPNLIALAQKYIAEGNNPDEFTEWIGEHLDEDAPYLNASISFKMTKKENEWEITMPSGIYEVLSGGMQSYVQEKNAEIYDSLKEGAEP